MIVIREDRLRAARFYLKSIPAFVQDWIDDEAPIGEVDPDITELAVEFARVRADEKRETRGAIVTYLRRNTNPEVLAESDVIERGEYEQ